MAQLSPGQFRASLYMEQHEAAFNDALFHAFETESSFKRDKFMKLNHHTSSYFPYSLNSAKNGFDNFETGFNEMKPLVQLELHLSSKQV